MIDKPIASLVALKLASDKYAWSPRWNDVVTRVFEKLAGKTVWRDELLWLGLVQSAFAGVDIVKEVINAVDLPIFGSVIIDPKVAEVLSKPELESARRVKSRHGRQFHRLSEKVMAELSDKLEPGSIAVTFPEGYDFAQLDQASTWKLEPTIQVDLDGGAALVAAPEAIRIEPVTVTPIRVSSGRFSRYLDGSTEIKKFLREPPDDDTKEREINVWIEERPDGFGNPLPLGERVTMGLNVGRPRHGRVRSEDDTKIRDVPAGGLMTEWVLVSEELELVPLKDEVECSVTNGVWTAKFSLRIPEEGESDIRTLGVIPRKADAALRVTIFSGVNVYRTFRVRIPVEASQARTARVLPLDDNHVASRLADVGRLGGFSSWAPRDPALTITVAAPVAFAAFNTGSESGSSPHPWPVTIAELASDINLLRLAADTFRDRHSTKYLDFIDPDDLLQRLETWTPVSKWADLTASESAEHTERWKAVASSKELRDLAYHGYKLYKSVFRDEKLRARVDALAPGQFLYVIWTDSPLDHVPWNLMYCEPPPASGPLDPLQFLGLRLRVRYDARPMEDARMDLGAPDKTYRGFALYWDEDDIGKQAQWQKANWSKTDKHIFRPTQTPTARDEVVQWFAAPAPRPIPFIYFYCETFKDSQDRVSLRFGSSNQNLISESELGSADFADHPLVFANACATMGGSPILANRVTKVFFDRKCRAYIGTESRVPVVFASLFAHVFLHLFERRHDGRPISAGEALAQARLFFWTQYRNLGGLYYCILNQYNAALATTEELSREAS